MNVPLFQILVIALVLLLLFGRRRFSETMEDFGEGVKRFREGIADDESHKLAAETAPLDRAADSDKTAG